MAREARKKILGAHGATSASSALSFVLVRHALKMIESSNND